MEAGKPGKAKAAAGERACDEEGMEMQSIDVHVEGEANGEGAAVNRTEARAKGKANGEANVNGNGVHGNGNGAHHSEADDVTEGGGVRSRQVPKSDSISEITEGAWRTCLFPLFSSACSPVIPCFPP